VGALALAAAALLGWGATGISAQTGYTGVGPNFVPWVVAGLLASCAAFLLYEAFTGGFRALDVDDVAGAAPGDWPAFAWVCAGVLANAALITRVGFVLSCTLCFALAVRGLRLAQGHAGGGVARIAADVLAGLLISAPTYWVFTKLLGIGLPGLTRTGWL
jgi:putative tricarboxylic transport membrane protein